MAKSFYKKNRPAAPLQWQVHPIWPGRSQLARQLHIPELIAQFLYNRGVDQFPQAQQFLQPSLNDLIEPRRLAGIDKAVQRIRRALADNEKIVLYGDYDVDGIAGVAILWRCLHLAGRQVEYYVPHRIDEGYGLNVEAIRLLAGKGARLIVTVDCGITAHESAREAARLGVDLIITDHHKIEAQIVPAQAVLHPDLPGQDYPNKDLCGAGVAFKLAWALAQEFSGSQKVSDEFREFLVSATALAGLGTIADVVPLLGENRVLARFGMQGLSGSTDQGIKALIEAAGLTGEKLQSSDVGFRLAPRLNAAGRMGHARLAVELFTKSSPDRAKEIAAYLESQNRLRQKIEKEITDQALQQVLHLGMEADDWYGMVLAGENWHAGVVGIVASRIVDKYHRPAVVISLQEGKSQGSCRSIPGFDICQALENCACHLLSFGGHAMAAGLSLEPDKIDTFRQAFNDYARQNIQIQELTRSLFVDAQVALQELTVPVVELIERLGPFGQGNPPIKLLAQNLKLVSPPRTMGRKGEHLQLLVAAKDDDNPYLTPGGVMRAVAFGKARWQKKLQTADSFDLVFEPVINRFNGNCTVEMIAEDFRVPE